MGEFIDRYNHEWLLERLALSDPCRGPLSTAAAGSVIKRPPCPENQRRYTPTEPLRRLHAQSLTALPEGEGRGLACLIGGMTHGPRPPLVDGHFAGHRAPARFGGTWP